MASPASIKKHPIHAMLIPFPIGLLVFSVVCDLIYGFGWGGQSWNDAALYTMAGGLIGAIAAAVPGLIDYASLSQGDARSIATRHLLANITMVVLFAVNLGLRAGGMAVGAPLIILSLVGLVVLALAGWLGGELVYAHGVAVETSKFRVFTGEASQEQRKTGTS